MADTDTTTNDRIKQGKDGSERLFTVRPRSSKSVSNNKRGTAASIRFILPEGTDKDKWLQNSRNKEAMSKAAKVPKSGLSDATNDGFVDFIAQSVSYNIQEKSQVMHTFGGAEAIYFFGKSPMQVSLTGLLIDDLDNDHYTKFMALYDQYLRGSKASSEYCYVEVSLANCTFTGSFTSMAIQQSSERDTDVSFSAQFIAKSYTLASTDMFFKDANSQTIGKVVVVRDPDPSITQETIVSVIEANLAAKYNVNEMTEESEDSISPYSPSYDLPSLSDYTKSFGTLPSVSDLIGFSAADINDVFSNIEGVLASNLKAITDIANKIDAWANEVVGLVESVENGLDQLIDTVVSATGVVYGAIDSIEDAYTTVCNFPQSMVGRLSMLGKAGALSPLIAGSENISSSDAMYSISESVLLGATRGTPEGDSASLALSASSTDNTLQVSKSGSTDSNSLSSGSSDNSLSSSDGISPSISVSSNTNNSLAAILNVADDEPPTLSIGG